MSDHDFEKQVRQKLADLKLAPTPAAWEKIESELRSSRRPRASFMWAALLLMVGGAYLVYHLTTTGDPEQSAATVLTEASGTAATPPGATRPDPSDPDGAGEKAAQGAKEDLHIPVNISPAPDRTGEPDQAATGIAGQVARNAQRSPVQPVAAAEKPALEPQISGNDRRDADNQAGRAQPHIITGDDNPSVIADNNAPDNKNKDAKEAIEVGAAPGVARAWEEDREGNTTDRKTKDKKASSGPEIPAAGKDHQLQAPLQPAADKLDHKNVAATRKDRKKWSFAVTAFSGANVVKEGITLFDLQALSLVTDVADRGQLNAPIAWAQNNNNPIPNAIPNYTPSSINPAFAYAAGVEAKRQLSDRLALSAGVRYLQLNTRSLVGRRQYGSQVVNNGALGYLSVSSYFTVEPEQTDYRNRYHFIDLPVELHLRFGKGTSLPVYWDAGLAVSQLLRSNSLHFDGTTGVYYQDDNLLNHTQLAVSTGFSIGLLNKTAVPLVVGPTVRYHISEILRKEVSGNKHFGSLGLQLKVFLK